MPRTAEPAFENVEDVAAPKTPMPNKNMSLTAETFEKSRKTVDATAGLELMKPTHSKNRTMSNFRTANNREMKTLNPFSTAKKSSMTAKLDALSYKNSEVFSKIFPNRPEDIKMIIPISGYAGHRRGDRSQNFFGKPFRETSL